MIFTSDQVFDYCVPLMFQLLRENHTSPLKDTAIACLCLYLRYCGKIEKRNAMIKQIIGKKMKLMYKN
jgi:hypothetical protein